MQGNDEDEDRPKYGEEEGYSRKKYVSARNLFNCFDLIINIHKYTYMLLWKYSYGSLVV